MHSEPLHPLHQWGEFLPLDGESLNQGKHSPSPRFLSQLRLMCRHGRGPWMTAGPSVL